MVCIVVRIVLYGYYVRVNSGNEELTWDRMFPSHAQVILTLAIMLITTCAADY